MTRQDVMKTAALTLRALSVKISDLEERLEKRAKAEILVNKMIDNKQLDSKDVLTKVAELESQSMDELKTYEKAMELAKDGSIKLGTVSENTSTEGMDPLTAFILED
jgi:hypothetical protein